MTALLLAALVSVSPVFPQGRYCVTPQVNVPTGLYLVVVIDVAPESAVRAKGQVITLKFSTKVAAVSGAHGACWWLQSARDARRGPVYRPMRYAP